MCSLAFWTWPLRFAAAAIMALEYVQARSVKSTDAAHERALSDLYETARAARAACRAWDAARDADTAWTAFDAMVEAEFAHIEASSRLHRLHAGNDAA